MDENGRDCQDPYKDGTTRKVMNLGRIAGDHMGARPIRLEKEKNDHKGEKITTSKDEEEKRLRRGTGGARKGVGTSLRKGSLPSDENRTMERQEDNLNKRRKVG